MRTHTLLAVLVLAALGACEPTTAPPAQDDVSPVSGGALPVAEEVPAEACDPLGFTASATSVAGVIDDRRAILPNGRMVAPEGDIVIVGGNPTDVVLDATGTFAYVLRQDGGLVVVDLRSGEGIQTVGSVKGYHGLALAADGGTLWTASMLGGVHRFAVGEDGRLTESGGAPLHGFLVDVAVRPGSDLVYVVANTSSNIYEIDPVTLETVRTLRAGRNPYELAFDPTGETLFTSNLGSDSVSVIDVASGEAVARIPVCDGPSGMVYVPGAAGDGGDRLYVACSNSDTVAVLDVASRSVAGELDLTGDPDGLTGGAVNELAFSPTTDRLFVSAARRNKVDIVRLADGVVEGSVATGHYPTALVVRPGGESLVVAATKGFGSEDGRWDIRGQLNVIPIPATPEELALATARVAENNARPGRFFPDECLPGEQLPPALAGGDDRPIRHVVLIVRENKTYDNLLGDLEGANGDPVLAIFGEDVTPNLHALARRFVNMDNFYADAEHSKQGHQWTTQVDCNDHTEKIRRFALPLVGVDEALMAGGGSIFEHCYANGVSFRNYGEAFGFGVEVVGELSPFVDSKFPFFNLAIPDVEKAAEFIRELEDGIFPSFVYIALPNDHTSGTSPGAPTPRWFVADNDAGTGMIVEAVSQSPFWPETVIFIIEDDPQSSGDHVHSHRSPCLAIGPHVRRGHTSSVQYSTASLYKTIELILGLPPINKNTRDASPMIDAFVTDTPGDEPDFEPYAGLPNPVPYEVNPPNAIMAAESQAIDWTKLDEAPGLGLILWRAQRGDVPMPAYAKRVDE